MQKEGREPRVRFLEGERIFITPRLAEDFETHYRWDHTRELVYLDDEYFRPRPYAKAKEQFETRINDRNNMMFSILLKNSEEHIGLIELYDVDDYERKCYWGILFDREYWGKGYGTETAQLMLQYVFEDLGFRRLKAYTHSGNPRSMKFHDKLGFVKEGVLRKEYFFDGAYVDGIDYGMLEEDYKRAAGKNGS